ncbi:MAG: hypothetical protein ACOVLL_05325 [Hydrogenophaga sp.]
MKSFITLASLCLMLVLTGCAAPPNAGTAQANPSERTSKAQQAQQTASAAAAKIPAWYLTPPDDEQSLYAVGVATSGDMQFAIDRAVLSAKTDMAAQVNSRVSARMNELVRVSGFGKDQVTVAEVERVTQNVVNEINLGGFNRSGYRREKAEVFPEGAGFRAYVLLRFPLVETTKIAKEQVQKSPALGSLLPHLNKLD